ncbi:hypothetical protein PGQ11_000880 [Apiospora arundinis]
MYDETTLPTTQATYPNWDGFLVIAEVTDTAVATPTGLPLTTRAPVASGGCGDQWWFSPAPGGPDTANNRDLLVSTQRLQGWSQCNKAAAYAPGICYEGHDFKAMTKVWTSNADVNWAGAPTSWVWKGICCRSEFDYATIKLLTRGTSTDLCTQTLTFTTATGFRVLADEGATATGGLTTIRSSTELEARHQPLTMWWNAEELTKFSGENRSYMREVMAAAAIKSRVGTARKTSDSAAVSTKSSPFDSPTSTTDGGTTTTLTATPRGISGAAIAGITIGSVLALTFAVLVGLMVGRRRRRNTNQNPSEGTEKHAAAYGGEQHQERQGWISRVLRGKRKMQTSTPYYPPGHPNEGISAPEVVTGDHHHFQMGNELAGQPRSELCGDSTVGRRPSELP